MCCLGTYRFFLEFISIFVPGANLTPIHTEKGMHPWWMTCRVETWLNFFLMIKNRVSMNSVNLEK